MGRAMRRRGRRPEPRHRAASASVPLRVGVVPGPLPAAHFSPWHPSNVRPRQRGPFSASSRTGTARLAIPTTFLQLRYLQEEALMLFRIHIKQSELGLLFRRGDFVRVLGPGTWFLPGIWFGRDRLEIVDTLATRFRHSLLDLLVRQPELRERLEVVDLSEDERALVWRDGRLFDFVSAGLFAYWRQPHKLRVETYSAAELRFQHAQLDAVLGLAAARASLATVDVE